MSNSLYIYLVLEILCFIFLIGAFVWISKFKLKQSWKIFFWGSLGVLVSQFFYAIFIMLKQSTGNFNGIFLSVLGLVVITESLRYLFLNEMISKNKENHSKKIITFALGWSALEFVAVIIMLGFTLYAMPVLYADNAMEIINEQCSETEQVIIPISRINEIKAGLDGMPWKGVQVVFEKLMFAVINLGFSFLAYIAIKKNQLLYLLISVVTSFSLYMFINYFVSRSLLITELGLLGFAVGAVVLALRVGKYKQKG